MSPMPSNSTAPAAASPTARCTTTISRRRCFFTARNFGPGHSSIRSSLWILRRPWLAPCAWRRLLPVQAAFLERFSLPTGKARSEASAVGGYTLRNHSAQSRPGCLRHIRLRRGVREPGGSECAGRLRREGTLARADGWKSASPYLGIRGRHDQLDRAAEYRRARLHPRETSCSGETEDGRI